jgi:hypothetical protein
MAFSAVANQNATIEEALFSVGSAPMLYNEDFKQLEWELSRIPREQLIESWTLRK